MEAKVLLGAYYINGRAVYSLHCHTCSNNENIFLTFVYEASQEGHKRALWEALKNIANTMEDAWCILGDFNSVAGDRMGGTDIQDTEVRKFEDCIRACDIQEMQSRGPYFSWTNKTIWIRIDRVFANVYWCDIFGFSQAIYIANSLSDHTALIIDTLDAPSQNRPSNFVTCG